MTQIAPKRLLAALALTAAFGAPVTAQPPAPRSPVVSMPAFQVPFSSYASPEAGAMVAHSMAQTQPDFGLDIGKARAFYGKFNDDRLVEMRRDFAFDTEHTALGGVTVDIVTPKGGIAPRNKRRVLINVHGGGFMWGSGSGAIIEAAPIAAVGQVKVVTVDYRLAPEHRYPAASEDVAAVYAALLKSYRPENIGIYGCSAGGVITAQVTAWFQTHGLPRPGAIGTLCGSGVAPAGDSIFVDAPLNGQKPVPAATPDAALFQLPYFAGTNPSDANVFPGASPAVLAKFPPTLLIAGGRDFMSSSSTVMHRRLVAAGVEAESFVFDGMPHAFFMWPDLPESKEVYQIIWRFFDRHLGAGE